MLLRITVFVMMSLGLLGFGTIAWLSMQPPAPAEAKEGAPPVVQQSTVLVAAHDLHAGALLKPDDIATVQVDRDKVPAGSSLDTSDNRSALVGSMVRRRVAGNDPLQLHDLLRPGDHGFLAAVLSAGTRAVTIGVDAITGSAGLIWPGDRVDVLLTHQIEDPNRPVGRRLAAETVLTNVRVIAIDQQLVQGAAPGASDIKPATTVTLEVTAAESERVSVAYRLGRLSLVVRAARTIEDGGQIARDAGTPGSQEPVRQGVTWASDVSPALMSDTAVKAAPSVVRIYRGGAEGQEYKF